MRPDVTAHEIVELLTSFAKDARSPASWARLGPYLVANEKERVALAEALRALLARVDPARLPTHAEPPEPEQDAPGQDMGSKVVAFRR